MTFALLLVTLMALPDLAVHPSAAFRAAALRAAAAEPRDMPPPPRDEEEGAEAGPRRWSPWDVALQGALAGLSSYDAWETNRFLRAHPEGVETNPLLGRRPSGAKLAAATALSQAGALLAADRLPQPWRRLLQLGLLGWEGMVVAGNRGYGPYVGRKLF